MERLAAPGRTPAVHRDDGETQRRQRLRLPLVRDVERRSRPVDLRARIDVVDHRVAAVRVEPVRAPEQSVDRRPAVGRGHPEPLRRRPAECLEIGGAGRLELDEDLPVAAEDGRAGRGARRRRPVDEVAALGWADGVVVERVVGEPGEAGAVEIDAADLACVRVVVDEPGREEPDLSAVPVDPEDRAHEPLPAGDAGDLPAVGGVEVEVSPAVALRPPEDLPGVEHVRHRRLAQLRSRVDTRLTGLGDQRRTRPGGRVELPQLERAGVPGLVQEVDRVALLAGPPPVGHRGRVEGDVRVGLLVHDSPGGDVEDGPRDRRLGLVARHRVAGAVLDRAPAAGRGRLDEHLLGQLALVEPVDEQPGRVRGPGREERRVDSERPHQDPHPERLGRSAVAVLRCGVVGQRELLAAVAGADPDVPVTAERGPCPVRRDDLAGPGRVVALDAHALPGAVRPLPARLERREPHGVVAARDLEVR